MTCNKIKEDPYGYLHIESPVDGNLSLCGWVDVLYEVAEGKPDCPVCIEVVKYCKKVSLSK